MPDERGMDMGAYYADDYLLIHQMPRHVGHVMPDVQQTFVPYFRRALQALRTETPLNACRQIGSLIHFVEDTAPRPRPRAMPTPRRSWRIGSVASRSSSRAIGRSCWERPTPRPRPACCGGWPA